MNHLPQRFHASGPQDRPPTRRAQAKQQTRERVLQAAKRLFVTRGYEATTIRDIAQEADMSTGAVFANFTDKFHLFHEVMGADLDDQMSLIVTQVDRDSPVDEAVRALFAVGYEVQLAQLPLLQAACSLSWAQGLAGPLGERPQYAKVIDFLHGLLDKALERRELRPTADTALLTDMLWDAYQANYRLALHDDWGLDRLNARFADQVEVILAGARA